MIIFFIKKFEKFFGMIIEGSWGGGGTVGTWKVETEGDKCTDEQYVGSTLNKLWATVLD